MAKRKSLGLNSGSNFLQAIFSLVSTTKHRFRALVCIHCSLDSTAYVNAGQGFMLIQMRNMFGLSLPSAEIILYRIVNTSKQGLCFLQLVIHFAETCPKFVSTREICETQSHLSKILQLSLFAEIFTTINKV